MSLPTTCSVILPIPVDTPYRYGIPTALADRVVPGARVVVPIRSREMVGIVLDVGEESTDGLRPVLLAPDPAPMVPANLLTLGAWVARHYAAPPGLTLKAMLPGTLWGTSKLLATTRDRSAAPGGVGTRLMDELDRAGGRATAGALARCLKRPVWETLQRLSRVGAIELTTVAPQLGPGPGVETVVVLSRRLPSLLERDQVFGRAARQRQAYDTIDALGGEASVSRVTGELGFSRAVIRGLVERGVARIEEREHLRDPFDGVASPPPATPSDDQRRAIQAILELPPGGAAMLFGVTGSGKTLVYLEAMRAEVSRGRGAIVLVPEIALTPQTIARVRGVFGDAVAVLHSALSDGERADAWRALVTGKRRVVVGARSAVFAPVQDLSIIVVDEEHDSSYKNGEFPRYHARDVAMCRARLEGARLVLGSATPSLETWAARERIRVVSLPRRVAAQPLPPVALVDMRTAARVADSGAVPWSETLDGAVRDRLARHEQIILLLNRRGFAHFLQCVACGDVLECPSCSVALTVHRTPAGLRCHYCGFSRGFPPRCEVCGGETQRTRGAGTQLLERWLAERFPDARLARMDADTTATKWSHRRILDAFARHEIDLLFGTQMIAKGLDFPGVTLVGVVDADTGLYLADFRAAERTFQLIAQVAGRAGRGPAGGEVLVQTRVPTHYALTAAARHDYEGFAKQELAERRSPPYPPYHALINVVVSGTSENRVAGAAGQVADWLRALVAETAPAADVVGPAPAPLARIKGRWRWHMILRCEDRRLLGRLLRYASRRAPHTTRGPIRVIFDRDPVSLL
ncbi:MAG: primosomal protein N' [Gemmatimonadetes bacterium]|nr:primosomal protein N' [Gemmatimonadota bacterium]